jgi:hypothetical protein
MMSYPLNGVFADGSGQVLWEDGERVFCRGWRLGDDGKPERRAGCPARRRASLAVKPRSRHHEYGLKDELDGAWAVRPLDLVREGGRFQDSRMAPGLYLKRIALPEAGEGPVWVKLGCAGCGAGAAGSPSIADLDGLGTASVWALLCSSNLLGVARSSPLSGQASFRSASRSAL